MLSTTDDDDAWYASWRARELPQLDAQGLAYLDYTGAALPWASVVRADADRIVSGVHGNPHSFHGPSIRASTHLEEARDAILDMLGTDRHQHEVILTANTSAACRLVGEGWRWSPAAPFLLAQDNHNSVVGLREYARRAGAPVHRLPLDARMQLVPDALRATRGGLFAFPAQSNFSGVRHPLALVEEAQAHGHAVLLDAAALLHSQRLDLRCVGAEFVVLSLYKIAGYPTGLGALVVRRDAIGRLARPWFAGGTVEWVSLEHDAHLLRPGAEGFEDGTPPFLLAGAVAPALAAWQRDGGARLSRHLTALTGELLDGLGALRHRNGAPMIAWHGPRTTQGRGATIACNLLRADGSVVPYWEVEPRASHAGVALRGGCFCNPGCAEAAFRWPSATVGTALHALGERFTISAFAEALPNHPVGALRLSLGLGSIRRDVVRTLDVLEEIGAGAARHGQAA
jgi:selenocysteine lyase/cysteine desulfurase